MDKMRFLNKIVNIILLLFLFLFLTFMCDTGVLKLGKGFVYYHEIKAILGKTDIPPTVLSFDYNRNYIIVKQKPEESNCGLYNPVEYVYPLGYDTTYYCSIYVGILYFSNEY